MRQYRDLRVANVIRDELSLLLLREVELEGAIATITEVKIDEGFAWADIFVSILPEDREVDVLHKLEHATSHLHHLLNKKMNIRPMPRIRFKLDEGLKHAAEIEKILLKENNK